MCFCIRCAGNNCAIVSEYIWIWLGARDQEPTSLFFEWNSRYITVWDISGVLISRLMFTFALIFEKCCIELKGWISFPVFTETSVGRILEIGQTRNTVLSRVYEFFSTLLAYRQRNINTRNNFSIFPWMRLAFA